MTLIDQILYHRIDYITVRYKFLIYFVIYILSFCFIRFLRRVILEISKNRIEYLLKECYPDEKLLYAAQIRTEYFILVEYLLCYYLTAIFHFIIFKNVTLDDVLLDKEHLFIFILTFLISLFIVFFGYMMIHYITNKTTNGFFLITTKEDMLSKEFKELAKPIENVLQDEKYMDELKAFFIKKDFEIVKKLAQEYTVKKEEK